MFSFVDTDVSVRGGACQHLFLLSSFPYSLSGLSLVGVVAGADMPLAAVSLSAEARGSLERIEAIEKQRMRSSLCLGKVGLGVLIGEDGDAQAGSKEQHIGPRKGWPCRARERRWGWTSRE